MTSANSSAPNLKRRWLQVSLRTFLVLVTIFSIWLGLHVRSARRQQAAVEAVEAAGGVCGYDFEGSDGFGEIPEGKSKVPRWLLNVLGQDFFHNVVKVQLDNPSADVVRRIIAFPRLRHLEFWRYRGFAPSGHPTDEEMQFISGFRLRRLMLLGDSELTDVGIECLARTTTLRELHVGKAALTDRSLVALARLPGLESLAIAGDFTDDGLANLRSHRNLQMLIITAPRVTDAGLEHIAVLSTLDTLGLYQCRVTDRGLQQLEHNVNLGILDLEGTAVSDASSLRQAFPKWLISVR